MSKPVCTAHLATLLLVPRWKTKSSDTIVQMKRRETCKGVYWAQFPWLNLLTCKSRKKYTPPNQQMLAPESSCIFLTNFRHLLKCTSICLVQTPTPQVHLPIVPRYLSGLLEVKCISSQSSGNIRICCVSCHSTLNSKVCHASDALHN